MAVEVFPGPDHMATPGSVSTRTGVTRPRRRGRRTGPGGAPPTVPLRPWRSGGPRPAVQVLEALDHRSSSVGADRATVDRPDRYHARKGAGDERLRGAVDIGEAERGLASGDAGVTADPEHVAAGDAAQAEPAVG